MTISIYQNFKALLFLMLLSGCYHTENQANKTPSTSKQKDWELDCPNKKNLITDPRNNFEINLDSIKDYPDYVHLYNRRIKDFVKHVGYPKVNILDSLRKYGDNKDTLEVIFKTFDPLPQIFPFITINDVQISLSQPLRTSGAGYFSSILPLDLSTSNSTDTKIKESVYNYFINLKPVPKRPAYNYNQLTGPYIYLDITQTNNISICLKSIIDGYLKAITKISKDKFDNNYCQLTHLQLEIIKDSYPLNIRLTGDHNKISN